MLGLKLYLYNSVILKRDLCILFTENCIVKSLLQNNNNDDKKLCLG